MNKFSIIMNKFTLRMFAAILLMVVATVASATEKTPAIVVWDGEQELYSFFISDSPQLKVEGGNAIITSDGKWMREAYYNEYEMECRVSIPFSESSSYRITLEQRSYTGDYFYCDEDMVDGIDETLLADGAPQFSMKDGVLRVVGLAADDCVSVSSLDGKPFGSTVANSNGCAALPLPRQTGTAVVKAGNVSFKIIIR